MCSIGRQRRDQPFPAHAQRLLGNDAGRLRDRRPIPRVSKIGDPTSSPASPLDRIGDRNRRAASR